MVPGATVMQLAAYIGYQVHGCRGALTAFIGFGLPAFLLMLFLSALYASAQDLWWVTSLFKGLQVLVVAIVAHAAWTFGRATTKGVRAAAIAVGSALLLEAGANPFAVILLSAGAGALLFRHQGASGLSVPTSPSAMTRSTRAILLAAPFAWAALLYFINQDLFGVAVLMMKIDLFAFGGGFASLPLMFHEVVEVRGWMDSKTLMDGIALGQITPGPIVITAAFVGYMVHQTAGAAVATLSIFMPSLVILVLTVPFFDRLSQAGVVQSALKGILASFVGLLLFVTVKFTGAVPWDLARILLATAALIALIRKVDLPLIVAVGAGLSIILFRP
jgi:chromate transporter